MNVQSEFSKYCVQGGLESLEQYTLRLDSSSKIIGNFIVDYHNRMSGIGKLIFDHSDLNSKIAVSKTCSKCNIRSKKDWFELNSRDFVLKYIQQGTSFLNYLSNGGWKEGLILGVKVAGIALTIGSVIQSKKHAANIPEDAPIITKKVKDPEGGEYTITYIDHPEARKAEAWGTCGAISGFSTGMLIYHGIHKVLEGIDVDMFFSLSQRDLIKPQSNFALRWTFPEFYNWKWRKLKEQLSSNPTNWRQDPELTKMICPISKDFMLFPVKDNCEHGHYFDYRSVRAFQLNRKNLNPTSCPLNRHKPNNGFLIIKFDKGMFDFIQSRLKIRPGEPLDCIQRRLQGNSDSSDEDPV